MYPVIVGCVSLSDDICTESVIAEETAAPAPAVDSETPVVVINQTSRKSVQASQDIAVAIAARKASNIRYIAIHVYMCLFIMCNSPTIGPVSPPQSPKLRGRQRRSSSCGKPEFKIQTLLANHRNVRFCDMCPEKILVCAV